MGAARRTTAPGLYRPGPQTRGPARRPFKLRLSIRPRSANQGSGGQSRVQGSEQLALVLQKRPPVQIGPAVQTSPLAPRIRSARLLVMKLSTLIPSSLIFLRMMDS